MESKSGGGKNIEENENGMRTEPGLATESAKNGN